MRTTKKSTVLESDTHELLTYELHLSEQLAPLLQALKSFKSEQRPPEGRGDSLPGKHAGLRACSLGQSEPGLRGCSLHSDPGTAAEALRRAGAPVVTLTELSHEMNAEWEEPRLAVKRPSAPSQPH